jgi:hypothetical protein
MGTLPIQAAAHCMCLLDGGKDPRKRRKPGFSGKGLTGFLSGCAAQMVSQFHERGEEFKDYWNEQWGVPKGTKGTVNPAILTVKTK